MAFSNNKEDIWVVLAPLRVLTAAPGWAAAVLAGARRCALGL